MYLQIFNFLNLIINIVGQQLKNLWLMRECMNYMKLKLFHFLIFRKKNTIICNLICWECFSDTRLIWRVIVLYYYPLVVKGRLFLLSTQLKKLFFTYVKICFVFCLFFCFFVFFFWLNLFEFLEMNREYSVLFEIASKYCISESFVDHDGYSISSKGFLPTVVDTMVIWVKFTHSSPFQFPDC